MSVSIFETELTDTEKKIRELNQELETETRAQAGFLDRVKLARQKMELIKQACLSKTAKDDQELVCVVPDFEDLRKGIRCKVMKNVLVDHNKKEDRAASSPSSKPGKSKHSTVKDLTIASPLRKKNRKNKETMQKMSVFIHKTCTEREEEKKRNSAIIQGFGERIFGEAQKKSRFAGNHSFTGQGGGGMAPMAARDSIGLPVDPDAIHRPSTLLQMRNSLFKFDTSTMVNHCIAEEELNIDEVLSDLSDAEAEIDILNEADEDLKTQKDRMLRLQIVQEDNHFLTATANYAFNVASVFDDEQVESSKFAQRVKILDSHTNDCAPCIFVHDDRLMQDRPAYLDDLAYEPHLRLNRAKAESNTLVVDRLSEKDGRLSDQANTLEARQIAKCALSVVYSNTHTPETRLAVGTQGHTVQAYKLYPAFSQLHFTTERFFELQTRGDSEVTVKTAALPVFLNYELTKQTVPIGLKAGDEFFFNHVDGLRVEGVLPPGFTEEQFEAFKPAHKQWDIECLNRHIFEPAVFKYFLLADKKHNKLDPDFFEKTMQECFTSHKNLARVLKFKKEYLVRMAKKSKNAVMKLSLIRKYDALGINKKISEVLLYLSDPYDYEENPDPAFLSSIKERLKQQFLLKKNHIEIGKSVQSRLPKIRNDFERSNLLYTVDTDYDLEIGYSKAFHQFYLKAGDASEEPNEDYLELLQPPTPLSDTDLTPLFKGLQVGCKFNEPREAFWVPLKPNSAVKVPSQSLLSYGPTVARVSNIPTQLI